MISCTQSSSDRIKRQEIVLSGEDWQLVGLNPGIGNEIKAYNEGYPEKDAIAAKIPGDVHWDLERTGKIPYLYYGMNTRNARWVTGKEWWYRKTFTIPKEWKNNTIRLRFEAVDYKTDIWLNGHHLGQHEGQFTPFDFELTGKVYHDKENILVVMIHSVPEPVRKVISKEGGEWEVMHAMRLSYPYWKSMTSSGWDWGADLVSMGIWQDVRLIASKDVYLANLTVLPEVHEPFRQATLNVELDALAYNTKNVKFDCHVQCLTVKDSPAMVNKIAELHVGNQRIKLTLEIQDPNLWWPNGYGVQNLYECSLTVRDAKDNTPLDQISVTFGIRDLVIESNPGSPIMDRYMDYNPDYEPGRVVKIPDSVLNYLFRINGVRIMGMGANWLPADLLFGRPGRKEYEHFISLAAKANMNLFRIWGGGIIDKQVFFDLCDQYGIMLFSEFPNGGPRLPETDEALQITGKEIREILPLMMNHPSVVRYGAGNEQYITSKNSRQMAQLRLICSEMDPTRPLHFPDPETIAQRHGPHGYVYDTHYQTYNTGYPLTAGPDDPVEWTEYGSSGASSEKTLRRILPLENLFPIQPGDSCWIWHKAQWAYGADNWLATSQYTFLFGELPDLATTISCSQMLQAEGLRYANQSMRRNMWHRSAFASWTYNEPWPNAAHGCLVEYYGQPKMAYYYVKKSCAPLDISCVYNDLECRPDKPLDIEVWVSNITSELMAESSYRWRIFNTKGKLLWEEKKSININPMSGNIAGKIRWRPAPDMDGDVALVYVELLNSRDSVMTDHLYTFGIHNRVPSRSDAKTLKPLLKGLLEASPTELEINLKSLRKKKKGWENILEINNKGTNNALFVNLDTETEGDYTVYFDDNYFFLLPGQSRMVEAEIVFTGSVNPSDKVVFFARAWNTDKVIENVELR